MEELRKQVIDMQHKIRDLTDLPGEPAAQKLAREVQALEDDLQVKKNARTIEDRVKRIIDLLNGEARKAPIMDIPHLQMLEQWFEGLRQRLQKLQ